MRAAMFATAACFLLAGPALADGPIATAGASPAAPQPAAPPAPLPDAKPTVAEGPPMAMGPCGPETVRPDGTLETRPHGEIEAGVGTGGYRHIAGAVCQPLGQGSYVAVGASDTQIDRTYRRR